MRLKKIKMFLSYLLVLTFLFPYVPVVVSGAEGDGIGQEEQQVVWNEPTFTAGFTDANATGFTNGWRPENLPITSVTGGAISYAYIRPTAAGNRYHNAVGMFTGHDVAQTIFDIRPGYAQPANGFHRIFFEDRTPVSNFLGIRAVPLEETGKIRLEWQKYNGAYSTIPGCESIDGLAWYKIVFTFDYVTDKITINVTPEIGDSITLDAGTADNRKPEWPIIDMVNCFDTTPENAFAMREYTVRTGDYTTPKPTGVTLSDSELNLNIGAGSQIDTRSGNLTATVLPAEARQDIIWTSSDPAIASVSQTGVVHAVGEGTAIIKAASVKDDIYGECEVTITYVPGNITPIYDNLTEQFNAEFSSVSATGFDVGNAGRNVDNGYLAVNGHGSGGRSVYHDYNNSDDIAEYRFGWRPGHAMPRQNWYEIYFESLTPSITPVFAIRQAATGISGKVNLQYWIDDGREARSNLAAWTTIHDFQEVSADAWYELVVTFDYTKGEMWLQIDNFRTEALDFSGNRIGRTLLNGWRIQNWWDIGLEHIPLGINKYTVSTGNHSTPEPTGVTLSDSELNLNIGAGSQIDTRSSTLTAAVLPAGARQDIVWTSSNPASAKVSQTGVVYAVGEGTAIIKAVSVKEDIYAECEVTVTYVGGIITPIYDNLTKQFNAEFSSIAATGFEGGIATKTVDNGYLAVNAWGSGGRSAFHDYNSLEDIAEYRFGWKPGYAMPRENWYEIFFESLTPSITPVFAIRQVSTEVPGIVDLQYWVDDGRTGRSNDPATWTPVPGFQGVDGDGWYELVVTFNYLTKEMWLQVDDFRTDALRFTGKQVGRTLLNGWRVSNWGDTHPDHIALGINEYTVSTGEYTGERPDPERVILSHNNVELSFGDGAIPGYNDRIQLTVEVEPSHALPGITWTSSNSQLVTVDGKGLVQAVATQKEDDGKKVTITATGINSTGGTPVYAECEVTITWKEYSPQPFVPDFEEHLSNYSSVFGSDFKFEDGTWLFEGVEHKNVIENINGKDVLNFFLQYVESNASGSRGRTVSFDTALNRKMGPSSYVYFDWNPGGFTPLEIRLRNGDSQILTLRSLGGNNGVAAYTGSEGTGWNAQEPIRILPAGTNTSAWYSFGIDFDFVNKTATVTAWERGKAFIDSPLGSHTFELTAAQNQINRMEILKIRTGGNIWSTTLLDNIFVLREKETDDTINEITVWHDPVRWPDKQPTPDGNYLSQRQYCVIPVGADWEGYLPEQVLCQLENGTSVYVDVEWQQPEYHNNGVQEEAYRFSKEKPGLYTFKGILDEEAGRAVNSKELPLEVYVEYRIEADSTKTNQLERSGEWLDRGVVAMPVADRNGPLDEHMNGLSGILVTWRMLSSEYNTGLTFNVYRNGTKVNEAPISILNYVDSNGVPGDKYKVEAVPLAGRTTDGEIMSQEVIAWNSPAANNGPFPYLDILLQRPKERPCIANGIGCESDCVVRYSINDTTAADVDGDGQYEILVQWITHGRDSSHVGYMAESIFDCYTLEGELLWRMNRGYNIGSGAHYPALHFYDLDEDGKAEFTMKTGVGTRMFFPKEDGTIDDTTDIPAWVLRTVDDNRSSGKQWADLGEGKYSSIDIPYAEPIWVRGTEADVNDDPRNANWPIYINGFFGSGPLWQVGGGEYNGTDPAWPAGKILQSPEFISVFDGLTGAPKENGTLPYFAPFDSYGPFWGDGYGNRADRFIGAVAYLPRNGESGAAPYPSIVENRGQYGPGDVAAYQWIDEELKLIWHYSDNPNSPHFGGASHGGNHNMSVADVDFDGYDEILFGGTAINEDGRILWATNDQNGRSLAAHGDAIHVSVMQPDSNEFYVVLPQEGPPRYGMVALNGSNGELVWAQGTGDTARGVAFNITPLPGFEVWGSSIAIYNVKNGQYIRDGFFTNDSVWAEAPLPNGISVNSGIYWDGDLLRELLDHWSGRPQITKFYYNENNPAASRVEGWWRLDGSGMNNGTKANPSLTLDLFGDWREELLVRRDDENALRIYSSNIPTDNVIYTLMHDTTYRQAVSWQNGGYNQPPHLGFYLGEDIADKVAAMELPTPNLRYTSAPVPADINYTITAAAQDGGSISPSGLVSVTAGNNQVFTIIPDEGYEIASVVVDGVEQEIVSTYTFVNVHGNHNIDVTFSYIEEKEPEVKPPVNYTITATAQDGGSISPSGLVSVTAGNNQVFTIIPNKGYEIASVVVDGVEQEIVSTYTFVNVSSNHNIDVTFSYIEKEEPEVKPPVIPPVTSPIPPTPETTSLPKKSVQVTMDGVDALASMNIYEVDKNGKVEVTFDLPVDKILAKAEEDGTNKEPIEVNISLDSKDLEKELENKNVKDIHITVQIFSSLKDNKKVRINVILSQALLQAAKDNNKDIRVLVVDEKEKENYNWLFEGKNLVNSHKKVTEVNHSLVVETLKQTELDKLVKNSKNTKALLINFSHEGALPAQATVRIYVGDKEEMTSGKKVYLYRYNDKTKKLETLPYSSNYKVDKDGYITVNILDCSDYVVLTKKAGDKSITSLRNQVSITPSKATLYMGGKKGADVNIQIDLPVTLEKVESLRDKTSSSAIGAVTVTYQSDNKKVAVVDSEGRVTPKGEGKAQIKTTIKLYSQKTKTITTTITVKP